MAYYYGKPDKETYRGIAALNLLKNLVSTANSQYGHNEKANAALHYAAVMLETQGYKITFSMNKELCETRCIYMIERMRVHILDTDEVLVVSFGIPSNLVERGKTQ